MKGRASSWSLLVIAGFLLQAAPVAAQTAAPAGVAAGAATGHPFLRLVAHGDGSTLELRVATYTKGNAALTLFSAVHLADAAHYAELQRRFAACDALLYELIAPPHERPFPGAPARDDDLLSRASRLAARALALAGQLDSLDYRPANFVHADLTDVEWNRALAAAKSSLLGELLAVAPPFGREDDRDAGAPAPRLDLVAAFRAGRGTAALRELAAAALPRDDAPPRRPTVILDTRNERCLDVLARQLAAGKTKLGIHYGAAHMPHFHARLVRDLGWTHTGDEWIVAWDQRAGRLPPVARGAQRAAYRARLARETTSPSLVRDVLVQWEERRQRRLDALGKQERARAAKQRRAAEFAASLERLRTEHVRETAALARLQAQTRAERAAAPPAGPDAAATQGCLTAIDATLARLRAAAVSAAAAEFRKQHGAVPALADLRLPWLPGAGRDPWGQPFRIAATAAGGIEVRSDGPDGTAGTADDVVAAAALTPASLPPAAPARR